MQLAIAQYQQQNQYLQRDNANALASLDQNHHKEVAELQVGCFCCHINILTCIDRTIWHLVFIKPKPKPALK